VHGAAAPSRLLTGVLAVAWVGGEGKSGLIDGNPHQVLTQLYGIGVVAAYDAIASLILLKLVDLTIGLRVESTSSARVSTSRFTGRRCSERRLRPACDAQRTHDFNWMRQRRLTRARKELDTKW